MGRLQAHRLAVPRRAAAADDARPARLELHRRCAAPTCPGSDLSGQRFREADLTDADLRECDLTGADLDRARLQSTKLRGADLRGASMDEVNWRGFELTGVRIDLVQAVQFARAHGALVAD